MIMYQSPVGQADRNDNRDYAIAAITFACVALCLFLDSNATPERQFELGICGWIFLIGLLLGETNLVRSQVLIAVLFATVGEHFASPYMGGYIYRFHNVPAYVPPGHGMVYLTAVALARSSLFINYQRAIMYFVLISGSLWSIWGITLASRGDWVGALLFCVFFVFVFVGRSPLVYLGAFFITTWLEIIGTWFGTWRWVPIDPVLFLPQGNPPSGVAAWYCLVDAVALAGAPHLVAGLANLRSTISGRLELVLAWRGAGSDE